VRLDHVSYAVSNSELGSTVNRLGTLLGATFRDGGVHPRFGTRNFVLPLAGGSYVEVVAPLDHPATDSAPFGKAVKGEAWSKLVHRIQYGGDEVVQAKDGAGSATLSMAYAATVFANALLRAIGGEKNVVVPTYVRSSLYESYGVDYFSSNVELGPKGVEQIFEVGAVSPEEEELIKACLPELKKNIEKGKEFVANST